MPGPIFCPSSSLLAGLQLYHLHFPAEYIKCLVTPVLQVALASFSANATCNKCSLLMDLEVRLSEKEIHFALLKIIP